MTIQITRRVALLAGCFSLACSPLLAQQPAAEKVTARASLNQAAQEGKFTFLLFYKQSDATSNAMYDSLKDAVKKNPDTTAVVLVLVGNPDNDAIVKKFDVARAPMPLTAAVAPNGAITGLFTQKVTPENIDSAIVSPTQTEVMKSLQDGKLVMVTVQGSGKAVTPVAVTGMQADPHFSSRFVSLTIQASDPDEAKFMKQMQLDPNSVATHTALLAPPGVMVGKFAATATKDEVAAALAKAGKCCDDPNCKHNQPNVQAGKPAAGLRKN
jgi:hypothetical protein